MNSSTTRRVWARFSKLEIGTKFSIVSMSETFAGYVKVEPFMVEDFGLVTAKRWEGDRWANMTIPADHRVIAILPRK